jgi:hypothetical protein
MKLYHSARYITIKESFFKTDLWKYAIFDILTSLIHPNLIANGICFLNLGYILTTGSMWNIVAVTYEINDILLLLTLWRGIYLIRFVVVWTKYYSDKSDRISKMMGYHLSLFFSIRCLIIRYPFRMLGFLTLLVCTLLSYMIHIIEGKIEQDGKVSQYASISNCMWNMYVTLTTGISILILVGYGDIYPSSNLGRLVIVTCAIFGVVIVSLIAVSVQRSLELEECEESVHNVII